jgi:hypothetical protein
MYIVRRKSDGATMMLASRPEDAQAWVESKIDGHEYQVERQGMRDQITATIGKDPDEKISN